MRQLLSVILIAVTFIASRAETGYYPSTINGLKGAELKAGKEITLKNITKNEEYRLICDVSERQIDILTAGGLLDYTKEENK